MELNVNPRHYAAPFTLNFQFDATVGETSTQGDAMKSVFREFFRDESGATAIEYGLIAAAISIVIITVLGRIGTNLNTKFTTISNKLN